jgi:hypothetical protein
MTTATLPFDRLHPLDQAPRGFMYGALFAAIVIQHIYVFSFNWIPELRVPLAGALAACHLGLAAITVLARPAPWVFGLLLSAACLVVSLIPAHFLGFGVMPTFDAQAALRTLILPLMMIWVLSYPLALPGNLLRWCAILSILLGTAIALTGAPVYVSGTPRLGSITGGLDQMHPSAKFLSLQLVLVDVLRRGRMMSATLAWGLIGVSFVVLLGYGGRNELVFVAAYYGGLAYFRYRGITIVKWSPPILLGFFLLVSYVALSLGTDVQSWGSGRIGVWQYRIQLLAGRDLIPLFFGGGVGSDIIWTPEWWYFDEGLTAHNDYLHFLMENGLIGLLAMGLFSYAIWIRVFTEGRAVLIGVLVNSAFSNGFFQSPLLAMNLALIFSASIIVRLARDEPEPFSRPGALPEPAISAIRFS